MVFNTEQCIDVAFLLVTWHGRGENKFIGYSRNIAPSSHMRRVGPTITSWGENVQIALTFNLNDYNVIHNRHVASWNFLFNVEYYIDLFFFQV